MKILSYTEAWEIIARALIEYAGDDQWDKAYVNIQVYHSMIRADECIYIGTSIIDEYRELSLETSYARLKAVKYIRNNILLDTGNRIWGILFTLYPDGRFEVEYDYNKPEGYEETDELITGEEINQSLSNLINR